MPGPEVGATETLKVTGLPTTTEPAGEAVTGGCAQAPGGLKRSACASRCCASLCSESAQYGFWLT